MGPAIFGVSVSQINLLLDTMLATFLPTGSVSWLYYSDRLSELPLGVFAVAIATVILPNLSRHHSASSTEAYSQTLDWALRMVLLIAVPAAAALMLLAEPILATLFLYGDVMTARDMSMATSSLRAYSLGLIAFMLIKVLAPGFFARQDMRTPVRIGVIAMVAQYVSQPAVCAATALLLAGRSCGAGSGNLGFGIFKCRTDVFYALRKKAIYAPSGSWLRFMVGLLLAVVAMLVVLMLTAAQFDALNVSVWQQQSWWQRSMAIGVICGAGFGAYLAILWLSGMRLSDLRGPAKATSRDH